MDQGETRNSVIVRRPDKVHISTGLILRFRFTRRQQTIVCVSLFCAARARTYTYVHYTGILTTDVENDVPLH